MLATVFSFAFIVSQALCACPDDWHEVHGTCMTVVRHDETWLNANKYCMAFGGELASLETMGKNTVVMNFLKQQNVSSNVWVSGNDLSGNGVWMWGYSDQVISYNFWGGNQGYLVANNNCIVVNMKTQLWDAHSCHHSNFAYLCER